MFLYAGKVITVTFVALCAVMFVGKIILQTMENPLAGKRLLQSVDKIDSMDFDPFTGNEKLIVAHKYDI